MAPAPTVLARGPWPVEKVTTTWLEQPFVPSAEYEQAADDAIAALASRDSPSHDGLAGRMAGYRQQDGALHLELQPARWSLRLVDGDASQSMSVLCLVRDEQGRWLAGRRAPWLASWAGRWSLGAGGSVDLGESPAHTLVRELHEEWGVEPAEFACEALVLTASRMAVLIGEAWLAADALVTPDDEHDAYEWWPAETNRWPDHAEESLRRIIGLLR
jgi:8-oxo-dGTP pyrophosphatase MutT (NUDIX family)